MSVTGDPRRRLQAADDALLANLSLDQLLQKLLAHISEALEVDTCAVLLLEGTELVARAAQGLEEDVRQRVRIPVGRGFAGRIAAEQRTETIENVDDSDVLNPILRDSGVKSLLGTPLIAGGQVLGVLHVGTLYPRTFKDDEIKLLETVAHHVALAVERSLIYDQIVRLTELQRDFIALAAHELRTPATTVYGIAATLRERRFDLPPATVERLEKTLFEQSDRMRRLVDQLLDLSRLDAGTLKITRERVQLRPHLEDILEAAAPGHGGEVTLAVPDELEALVDPVAVDHVVANLVSNALRYGMPPVVISAAQHDHHVRIAVEDRGSGVADEFVPYMFDRFRRSEPSPGEPKGTGLGLAIARSYARAHGGDLLYAPLRPQGARFELVLPAEPLNA